MARSSKLKVYRTPIGFHDAYVAAPSQKAAIEAWGSDRDVFTRGEAELVTDPELTKEPLARPGEVVKRMRGSAEENLAALPPNNPKRKSRTDEQDDEPKPSRSVAQPKPKPRPSRRALDKAEEAIETKTAKWDAALERLRKKEAALAKERKDLERKQTEEIEALEQKRDAEAEAYRSAMTEWRS
jgi:hypothetical protein